MKHVKKLASLLLALVMVLSITVTAFAAENDPKQPAPVGNTITVKNAQGGETYAIYKMLDLKVSADKSAYSYTVNENWTNFFTESGAGASYVEIDEQGYVTWKDDKKDDNSMEAFGKEAAKFAADNRVQAAKDSQTPDADGNIIFSELDPGYYLITSTNGTEAIVDTTPTEANPEIAEKNVNPSIDKQVQEDSKIDGAENGWGDTNDAEIGQTVNFKTVIAAKSGAKNYVVHDKMSVGLTLDSDSIAVAGATKDTDYTVAENTADECTFEITFEQSYLDRITTNTDADITITYSATLNKGAVIASTGNTNETRLTWGDAGATEWEKTTTYVWEMDVLKYGNGKESNILAGAQFVLLSTDKKKVAKFDADGKIMEWVTVPEEVDGKITWPEGTIQTTNADGKLFIKGLDAADQYYLREVQAPEGYNLLNEDKQVQIAASVNENDPTIMAQEALTAKVNNQSGTELPSTGGMGTTIFYVVGSILLAGAAILLVTKKRMSAAR